MKPTPNLAMPPLHSLALRVLAPTLVSAAMSPALAQDARLRPCICRLFRVRHDQRQLLKRNSQSLTQKGNAMNGGDTLRTPANSRTCGVRRRMLWLLLPLLTVSARAQDPFRYVVRDGAVTITGYTGMGGALRIPDTINGLPVTAIWPEAFHGWTGLKSVAVPKGVTNIPNGAFSGCSALTNITIPDTVTSIGEQAFSDCSSLTGVIIPHSVSQIAPYTFVRCTSLTDVQIPTGVTSIGYGAFLECTSLTNVTIPKTVSGIGSEVFSDCSQLIAITVEALNPAYGSVDGVLFSKNPTTLFACPGGKSGSYSLPDTVLRIGDSAFAGCERLTSITIPNGVTSLGRGVFSECTGLTNVTISDTVTSVGNGAFWGCSALASLIIPANLTIIGDVPFIRDIPFFRGCSNLTAITVPADNSAYSSLDGVLFSKDQRILIAYPPGRPGGYAIPDGVTNIRGYAFMESAGLSAIAIPDSVTRIASVAFWGCTSLTNVGLPNSVTELGEYAFSNCDSLAGVSLSHNLGYIQNGTLSGCSSLAEVTFPDSVTNIGFFAFSDCTNLANVTLGSGVQNIGLYSFPGCNRLTTFTVDGRNAAYSSVDGVLFSKSQSRLVQFPPGRTGSYVVPASTYILGWYAFENCAKLSSVTIPDGVFDIERGAFWGCVNLTNVAIGSSVTNIWDSVFSGCINLANVAIGSSVKSIGGGAFNGCTSLTSVMIPKSVSSIAGNVFVGCSSLTEITVDPLNATYRSVDGVLFGEYQMFDEYQNTLIAWPGGRTSGYTIPDGVTMIESDAFSGCTGLTAMTIPNSVTTIGSRAFSGCTNLVKVTIGGGVSQIGWAAFVNCVALEGVYFQGDAPEGKNAFREEYVSWTGPPIANIYYLPGTTGWTSSFADRPTGLWLPQVQTNDASFRVRTNRFGFNIAWATDKVVVVEACADLGNPNWTPVGTNLLTGGLAYFSDPQWANHPARFYRLRAP